MDEPNRETGRTSAMEKATGARLSGCCGRCFADVAFGVFAVFVAYASSVLLLHWLHLSPSPLKREASSLIWALQDYRASHGIFPIFTDTPVSTVVDAMASSASSSTDGILSINVDSNARYVSNGKIFGLLFTVPQTEHVPPSQCLYEFAASATGWWGQPPKCHF